MDTGNRALQWLAESLGPYAPRLIGALTIALAAWLAARLVRAAITRELDNILLELKEASPEEKSMVIEQFYAAVYEHGKLPGMQDVRPELRRFLAVVSNLYRSFVNAKKRESLQVPQVTAPTPLAFFQSNGDQGPYTITSESMKKIFGPLVASTLASASVATAVSSVWSSRQALWPV